MGQGVAIYRRRIRGRVKWMEGVEGEKKNFPGSKKTGDKINTSHGGGVKKKKARKKTPNLCMIYTYMPQSFSHPPPPYNNITCTRVTTIQTRMKKKNRTRRKGIRRHIGCAMLSVRDRVRVRRRGPTHELKISRVSRSPCPPMYYAF